MVGWSLIMENPGEAAGGGFDVWIQCRVNTLSLVPDGYVSFQKLCGRSGTNVGLSTRMARAETFRLCTHYQVKHIQIPRCRITTLGHPICLSSSWTRSGQHESRNLKSNTSEVVFKSSRNLRGICTTIASSNQENQLAEVLAGHGGQRGVSLH